MSEIEIVVYRVFVPAEKRKYWEIFKRHHYLTADLNVSADCFVGYLWGNPVVFYACLRYPSGSIKNAYRGHRLVVLPDYQGMGVGNRFSELIGQYYLNQGNRFFAKTASIKLGNYRSSSSRWRPTSKNQKRRMDIFSSKRINKYSSVANKKLSIRLCYSHEYIGGGVSV